jgi:hypothetical protein
MFKIESNKHIMRLNPNIKIEWRCRVGSNTASIRDILGSNLG